MTNIPELAERVFAKVGARPTDPQCGPLHYTTGAWWFGDACCAPSDEWRVQTVIRDWCWRRLPDHFWSRSDDVLYVVRYDADDNPMDVSCSTIIDNNLDAALTAALLLAVEATNK